MALISISGVGRAKKKAKPKAQKKAKVTAKKKIILAKIKKVGKVTIKYNPLVATARNSFLVLVQLNVFNLAKRLNILLVKNPRKLMNFWTKLSGNFSSLQKAINKGKQKKAIIGVVTVAASIATATPILVKILKFLEENNIGKEEMKQIKKAILPVIAKAVDKKITQIAQKEVSKEEKKQAPIKPIPTNKNIEEEEEENEEEETIPTQTNNDNTEDTYTENQQVGYYC